MTAMKDSNRTLAILQARMSSKRLPGKVLKPVLGKPMLTMQCERLKRAKNIQKLVIATSDQPEDDEIAAMCGEFSITCFRGSLSDVLGRFHAVAQAYPTTHIVRLTGDCPLADPGIIDEVISFCVDGGFDYASNTQRRTYPHGLDVEVMRRSCLDEAAHEARSEYEREHVTPYLYRRPKRYAIGNMAAEIDHSHLRWTVDWAEDYDFICAVYEALYPDNPDFRTEDVIALLKDRPEIVAMNASRNEIPAVSTGAGAN
jgi:spore coat polysaccharide biosynthesis protein SpsF